LTDSAEKDLPVVVFFNINGSGMGHMSTCLAYANRLRGRARPVFFSLASAMEFIHGMGFEGDYLVSRFWSRASAWDWDRELALRLGLLFEHVRPKVVVFDGTWPYRGLLHACRVYGEARTVWSNLVLYKKDFRKVPVSETNFDLVIRLGEIGSAFAVEREHRPARTVVVPPVTVMKDDELLDRRSARRELGLREDGRYALFSLGPGNLKDVSAIGAGLIDEVSSRGYEVLWTRTPISESDVPLPDGIVPLSVFPLARYMRAFDILASAAGYNTCCEVLQSRVPTLFVPNTLVADDQARRAAMVARAVPAVISPCESEEERRRAVDRLVSLADHTTPDANAVDLSGAERVAEELLQLV